MNTKMLGVVRAINEWKGGWHIFSASRWKWNGRWVWPTPATLVASSKKFSKVFVQWSQRQRNDSNAGTGLLKNRPIPASFIIYIFGLFKPTLQFLQQFMWKIGHLWSCAGIQTHNLLTWVSSHNHETRAPVCLVHCAMVFPENNHRWGKDQDHCTAGLQFKKTGFDQKRKYVVNCF